VPAIVDSHSGPRVLTMEYVDGTKISDVEAIEEMGVDRTAVARRLQRAYLRMIIDDGVYHADPHPGNLAVQADGTIVFYDFGMSGRVDELVQEQIIEFYIAVANQDIEGILDALIEMGTLSPEADRAVMAEVMELAIQDARGEEIEQYRVQQIVSRVEDTIYEFPLRLPSNLALVLRVATVVEGVCVTLDPDFDFITVATDYLGEQGYLEESARQLLGDAREEIAAATRSAVRAPPKLERLLDRFDRNDFYVRADIEDSGNLLAVLAKRLVYGLLLTGGVVSTAVLYAFEGATAAAVAGVLTLPVLVALLVSFRRGKGLSQGPQFTRQNMRERRQK